MTALFSTPVVRYDSLHPCWCCGKLAGCVGLPIKKQRSDSATWAVNTVWVCRDCVGLAVDAFPTPEKTEGTTPEENN